MSTRRVHERYDRRLKVVIRHEGQEYEAVTRNISLGGMYIVTDAPLPFGGETEVRFRIPNSQEDTVCNAYVRWTQPEGVGIQFSSLRAREVWALNKLFREREDEERASEVKATGLGHAKSDDGSQ